MPYHLEAEMMPALRRSLPALLVQNAPYVVGCEVPDGSRVIDVMYAVLPTEWHQELQAGGYSAKFARLTVAHAIVLSLLWKERKMSLKRLSKLTYISEDRLVAEYLVRLKRNGLVEPSGKSWAVTGWANAQPPVLIAVEAKLREWREALAQAKDNRVRSDLSYIAMPRLDDKTRAREIYAGARDIGVGVIELNPDGVTTISVKAERVPPRECHRKWEVAVRLLAKGATARVKAGPPELHEGTLA